MWADFKAAFVLDGARVHLARIDMPTDGAQTTASGDVDFSHWPNMQFAVKSRVNFPRMREIFFTNEKWRLKGDGDFTGVFRLYPGGHNLKGTFASQAASVDELPFPGLYGSLQWNEQADSTCGMPGRSSTAATRRSSIRSSRSARPRRRRSDLTSTSRTPIWRRSPISS